MIAPTGPMIPPTGPNPVSRLEDRVADLEGDVRDAVDRIRALEKRLDDFIAGRFSPPDAAPANRNPSADEIEKITSRRFGSRHEKPCVDPSKITCAVWECQVADRCRLLPPEPAEKSNLQKTQIANSDTALPARMVAK